MKILFFLLISFLSFSSLAETRGKWVFDSLSSVEKTQLSSVLSYLNKRDVKLSVRSIYDKYNIDTSKGDELYSFVFSNVRMIIGESAGTKICSIDGTGDAPLCSNKSNNGLSLNKPSIIYIPNSYLALWDIKKDLDSLNIKSGGFVLSGGGYVKIDSSNSKALIYLSKSVNVDGEPLAIKIISEMFGYSLSVELIEKNIAPFTTCNYLLSKYTCQGGNLGYFEPVGDLLLDMAKTCITCSEKDRLLIKYWSLESLSRYLGDKSKMNSIYRMYFILRDDMKKYDLDISFIEKRYRQHLSTGD